MRRIITAIERDGMDIRILTLVFEVPDNDFNLEQAVRKACTAYCKTEEGKAVYEGNCQSFNWADFEAEVPNEICQQFGFQKIDSDVDTIEVNWDEHLVNDDELESDEEE